MIKENGEWRAVDWEVALGAAAAALREGASLGQNGEQLAALASPHSTFEELYLLQALVRGLGSGNVDHRLRQIDFRLDSSRQGAPWLGMPIAEVSTLDAVLVVGSNLRKDHPLLAVRLRQSARKGARLHMLHAAQDDLAIKTADSLYVRPSAMPMALAEILVAVAASRQIALPSHFGLVDVVPSVSAQAIASSLLGGKRTAVLLGNFAVQHPAYSQMYLLAEEISRLTFGRFGVIGEAANSVGADVAGAVPYAGPFGASALTGQPARALVETPRQVYLLLGTEPDLDMADGVTAQRAMHQAKTVISLTAFTGRVAEYADIILPIAPFTETAGSFVNTEGRLQSAVAAVKPQGQSRPAWKVLRVLANLLGLQGFDFDDIEELRRHIHPSLAEAARAAVFNPVAEQALDVLPPVAPGSLPGEYFERVADVAIYQADPLVRRAPSLRLRQDSTLSVGVAKETLSRLGVQGGETVCVSHIDQHAELPVSLDAAVLPGTVKVPVGYEHTIGLGTQSGAITLERLG
jgi:NADH-quinone oxidoreductase subunit G